MSQSPAPEPAPCVFLVDGSALAYRSHFAFLRNPLVTRKGELVSAVFGFTHTLLRILQGRTPSHLAVVFDAKGPTFRHERYPQYKATREKMPDELVAQLPWIDEVLEALEVLVLRQEGCEADDVIGTLARRAKDAHWDVRIVSGDKDFFQLVDERVQMFQTGKGQDAGEVLGAEAVEQKFGVGPGQIVDLLALMGDSSDNVPGVPRVGPKTATELLRQYATLEGVYEHLDEIKKPALRKNLGENRDLAELSRELVTIQTDIDLGIELDDLRLREFDQEAVRKVLHRFEFRSLLDMLPEPATEGASQEDRSYSLVESGDDLDRLAERLRAAGRFALDTETTSLDPLRAELVGISVATAPAEAYYVPFRPGSGLFGQSEGDEISADDVRDRLGPVLADPKLHKIGQNAKYDLHVLERHGFTVRGVTFDTMLAHYCTKPSAASHSLDSLALEYFGHTKIKTTSLLGKGKSAITMAEVPKEDLCEYACEDADYTLRLCQVLEQELRAHQVDTLFHELEMPLVDVLRRMEAHGVALDIGVLEKLEREVSARLEELEKAVHALADEPFNLNSPRQLGAILFEKLELHVEAGLKRIPKTKTGYSTSAEALAPLRGFPIVDRILEYRQLEKLRGTYLQTLPKLVHPQTKRIHTSFNQTVAATGRLSSSDPNLQNIPIRTALGRKIRAAFVSAHDGGTLLSADYSQVELRLVAHLAEDENLLAAFRAGVDVHRHTASLIFGTEPDAVDAEMRTRAKAINFGIIYGMGAQRLARETGLTFSEAQKFIARYFEVFSGVKRHLDRTLEDARRNGYVTTLLGRRRAIPELESEDPRVQANAKNVAVNTPIQGTAADLIKKAMVEVDRRLTESNATSRMILQVHDELVFDVAPGESEQVRTIARESMEGALELRVPLLVEIGEGTSWAEAH